MIVRKNKQQIDQQNKINEKPQTKKQKNVKKQEIKVYHFITPQETIQRGDHILHD